MKTVVAFHNDRCPLYLELSPFGDSVLAEVVKIFLNPLIFKITQLTYLEMNGYDFFNLVRFGIF